MIVVGLTGGIASGKTTIVKFLKNKRFTVHDSDLVIKKIYNNPTHKLINYLKKIKLEHLTRDRKINKKLIREEIFSNTKKRKLLEIHLHNEVKKARDGFLKIHKKRKTKVVFLDIPLLFENKLDKICDYTILLYAPIKVREKRAIKRKGMKREILKKIINAQLSDKIKKNRADFVISTTTTKAQTFKNILLIINSIL